MSRSRAARTLSRLRPGRVAARPGNRVHVTADWLLDAVLPRQAVRLGLVRPWTVPLDTGSPELPKVPSPRSGGSCEPSPSEGGHQTPRTKEDPHDQQQ